MATTTKRPHCAASTKSGQPCQGFAIGSSGFCFVHDPAVAAKRAEARRMGGRARHGRKLGSAALSGSELGSILTIETVADVMGLLRRAVADTLMLERSLGRARTVGYLAGIMLKALEVGELEERIAALEAQLNRGRINGVYQNQN